MIEICQPGGMHSTTYFLLSFCGEKKKGYLALLPNNRVELSTSKPLNICLI